MRAFVLEESFAGLSGRFLLEGQVLGCLLWNPVALGAVNLTTDDFLHPVHREVYAAMLEIDADGGTIDEASVVAKTGKASSVCKLAWLVSCTGENILFYLKLLKREIANAKKRQEAEILRAKVADGADAAEAAQKMNRNIEEIEGIYGDDRSDEKAQLSEAMRDIIARIRERSAGVPTLDTGIEWIDTMAKGFLPGDYITLAARPSCGKTALAMQIMASMASNGHKVMFLSLEMDKEALSTRLLSLVAMQCAGTAVRNPIYLGKESREHFLSCQYDAQQLAKNIWVVKKGIRGPECLATKIKQAAEDGCSMVVCDYIGLVPHRGNIQKNQKIDEISKAWKWALGDNGIPGLMLSQLNRGTEKDKRAPVLSDLKDSGSIEEDSDYVWFLHRPNGDMNGDAVPTKLIQAKGRNVGVGARDLIFCGPHQRFAPVELSE